jgi:hypothetical protein
VRKRALVVLLIVLELVERLLLLIVVAKEYAAILQMQPIRASCLMAIALQIVATTA